MPKNKVRIYKESTDTLIRYIAVGGNRSFHAHRTRGGRITSISSHFQNKRECINCSDEELEALAALIAAMRLAG